MRARIGIAMGLYWDGIVQLIDVIAMISALGAIGSLPVLLNAVTKYTRFCVDWLRGRQFHTTSAIHACCNKV
jgi:hypothetical protein